MRRIFLFLALGLLTVVSDTAWASTPDGQTPAQETVCDGETGAAYGLCNAYCEAMDCDSEDPHASPTACDAVRRNFERKTGRPLPCDVTCPCLEALPLFQGFVNGSVQADACIEDDNATSAIAPDGAFVLINAGTSPPTCSVNLEAPILEITPAEAALCRQLLSLAVTAQGGACTPPE